MREIKKQICLRWDEMLLVLVMEAGMFLLGEILLGFVVYGLGEKESVFPLGTLMALLVPAFVMMFLGMSSLPFHFNISVSMGTPRRYVVPAMLVTSLFIDVAAAWATYLFYSLEKGIFQIAYAGIEVETDLGFVFQWKYILPVCLLVVALNALTGAMFLKFGKKVFTIFWILWMVVFIGGPRMMHLLDDHTKKNAFLSVCRKIVDLLDFSERGILTAAVCLAVVLAAAAWMVLRRQQVEA